MISQPKLLYGTRSLVLCGPDIYSSGMTSGMQQSDLYMTNIQETSEGLKARWTVH